MKKTIAISAICIALVLNLQYTFTHSMGLQVMAAANTVADDSESESSAKPHYYVASDAACTKHCYHVQANGAITYYDVTGTETDCPSTTTKSSCTVALCDAACFDGDN